MSANVSGDEQRARSDSPRCGVWCQAAKDGDAPRLTGDSRLLSQADTDTLIAVELNRRLDEEGRALLHSIVGDQGVVTFADGRRAGGQRGGIHTDEGIRLIAFREWGDRDRLWSA